MYVAYHPGYVTDIGAGHRFPMQKYRLVYERLLAEGTLSPQQVVAPAPAAAQDLLLVHTHDYVARFLDGDMTDREMRTLGFPWSAGLARRALLAVNGTITASRLAWRDGLAANLAGSSHHAFVDHGEGFSVFNDIATAIRVLQRENRSLRAAVVDCDVHQGNGTAAIFAEDPDVYTCSLHGEKNYPFEKPPSDLDVGLPDGAADAEYLAALDDALEDRAIGVPSAHGVVSGRRGSLRRRPARAAVVVARRTVAARCPGPVLLSQRRRAGRYHHGRGLCAADGSDRRGALPDRARRLSAGRGGTPGTGCVQPTWIMRR